jgi:hypothetical protein
MSTPQDQFALTEEQKEHWLKHGFIKVPQCFTREAAAAFTSSVWTRLGVSPTDKSTWTKEKVNMPGHTKVNVEEFAPKAWHAICDLVGGADRVADWCKDWKDGWIVNMGKPEYTPQDTLDFRSLGDWHNDGDWFIHFLDSPEQALLVIPLFSDIKPKGGGTVICTDGIGLVAKHLVGLRLAALYYSFTLQLTSAKTPVRSPRRDMAFTHLPRRCECPNRGK